MNQVFFTDVINWVGVAVGVLGAIIIAPSGFTELVRQLRTVARRVLLGKPKDVAVFPGAARVSARAGRLYPLVTMSTDLPDHELVRQLVLGVNELSKQAVNFQQESDARYDEVKREIGRIETGGQRSEAEIRSLISEAERQNARFNARGLPLIALGIVMTGPTGILAEYAPVGWLFVSLGVFSMIYGVWPWRSRRRHRSAGNATEAS